MIRMRVIPRNKNIVRTTLNLTGENHDHAPEQFTSRFVRRR